MKLVLCAGERKVPGFKTHDIQGVQDYRCDLFDIETLVDRASCQEIHFTHALEHFPTKEVPKVLDLIYGLLEPKGKLYIEVPNFEWFVSLLAEKRDRDAIYYCFGGQLDEYDFHKTGFTGNILREELEDAGFQNIEIQPGSTLCAKAMKP